MAEEPSPLRDIPYTRLFPWVRLFRAVRVATDAKKLILAVLGLVLTGAGWDALDRLFPASSLIRPPVWLSIRTDQTGILPRVTHELGAIPWRLAEPPSLILSPFFALFSTQINLRAFLHALLAAAWAAAVWGLIGGSISRLAVAQVACGERLPLVESIAFGFRRALPLVGGPLTPLLGVATFALFNAVFGLLYRIPGSFGPLLAGVLLFLPLLGGLLMALILAGLAAGWPLIHASTAAEDEDGFDALSRSYAYVHQRPGRYAAYVALAWLIGIGGYLLVDMFARLVVHLTQWSLSFTASRELLANLLQTSRGEPTITAVVHSFWLLLTRLLVRAWTYSYFWTAFTMIYLLLRKSVDGTPWHQIAMRDRRGPTRVAEPNEARSPTSDIGKAS